MTKESTYPEVERRHCAGHSGTQERLAVNKEQIEDLYHKHEDTRRLLGEIKTCISVMSGKMDTGFMAANVAMSTVSRDVAALSAANVAMAMVPRDLAILSANYADIAAQQKELSEFKWFRDWMNKLRNRLPKVVLWGIIAIIGFIAVLNWNAIGDLLRLKVMK